MHKRRGELSDDEPIHCALRGEMAPGPSYPPLAVFIIGAMPAVGDAGNSLGARTAQWATRRLLASHTPKRMGVNSEAPSSRRQKLAWQDGRRRGGRELAGKLHVTDPEVDFCATISGEDAARWGKRPL